MSDKQTTSRDLLNEYRPTMPDAVLRLWAADATREIERLREALETARLRFEMIAVGHSGASAEVGAREARRVLYGVE